MATEALLCGADLLIFDNLSRTGSAENLSWLSNNGKFDFKHGDIRIQYDVEKTIREFKPEVIFHLAGQVAMTTSIDNPRMDFEVNALGSLNVLEAVRTYSPETVVLYSSTNKVYGDLEQFQYEEKETRYICKDKPNGFDETVNLDFHSPYGSSKGSADQYMLDYSRIYGLKTAVFRHSSMFGGRQFSTFDQGWLGWFTRKALDIKSGRANEKFTINGNGKQVRDLLYASDCVALYMTAAQQIDNICGQAFNIGGGMENSSSLLELFNFLERELGIEMEYTQLPPRESDQKVFVADITKVTSKIDWQPKIDKEVGIRKMIDWVSEGE